MDMILTDHTTQYLYLVSLTGLTHKFADSKSKIAHKQLITIFRYPNKMIFNLIFSVAALAIVHANTISQLLAECYPPERRGF